MRLLVVAALALTACGPATQTLAGYVIDVQSTALTEVQGFTLRTPEGEEVAFRVGALDIAQEGFPASHLREHMATNFPIAVAFTLVNDDRVATRLVDAPWLLP